MFNTLSDLAEKLNSSDILWAVGGSILLNQFGLIDKMKDIDLFVDIMTGFAINHDNRVYTHV